MPLDRLLVLLAALAVAVAASVAGQVARAAAGERGWRPPVDAPVTRGFDWDPRAPFAAGAHRGVDFAVAQGAPVRAPCGGAGRVAGRVADRRAVTVDCGRWWASVSGLASVSARRGRTVRRGQGVGRAGTTPVQLGARPAGRPRSYVDPEPLLAAPPVPTGPAPPVVIRRPRALPPPGRPAARLQGVEAPQRAPVARTQAPPTIPWTTWAGLVAVALGAGGGTLVRRGSRRRAGRPVRTGVRARAGPG